MRFSTFALTAVFALFATVFAPLAHAQLRIDVTKGNLDPFPIAVTNLNGSDQPATNLGAEISQVITNNLRNSGLFAPVSPNSFIEDPRRISVLPRFGDWRLIDAQALVTGTVRSRADGRFTIEFRLWDVFGEKQMTGLKFTAPQESWRKIAHKFSDKIYERLTGESGYFDSKIVYVAESGPKDKRIKRLAIVDQDGAGHRYLTNGSDLVLTPRFSPSADVITYLSYETGQPRVYLMNIFTAQKELLGNFPGMTYAPRFSPDGKQVIFAYSNNGNSDVFTMDLQTRATSRLTRNPAIDTSPSFAPDGRAVTFNSDRSGAQQIYTMDADGRNAKRISFGNGRYGTPVWSPRADLIAFTKIFRGKFYIGVMRYDGTGERLLTESWLDESPTWSPNGRVIQFFRERPSDEQGRGGGSKIYSVDLTGYNLRELVTPVDGSDPAWSPLLPLNWPKKGF